MCSYLCRLAHWQGNKKEIKEGCLSMVRKEKYDVFISYRRDRGALLSEKIYSFLTGQGYKCFFDKSSIRGGKYADKICSAVRQSRFFLLVLTNGSIERCCDTSKEDYVREEIKCALNPGLFRKICIVPVVSEEERQCFPTDDELCRQGLKIPDEIREIRDYHITKISESDFFDETMEKLVRDQLAGGDRRGISWSGWKIFALLVLVLACVHAFRVHDARSSTEPKIDMAATEITPRQIAATDKVSQFDNGNSIAARDLKCLMGAYLNSWVTGSREEHKRFLSKEGDEVYERLKSLQNDARECLNAGMTEDEIIRVRSDLVMRMSDFRNGEEKKIRELVAARQYEQALKYWTTVNMILRSFDGTPFERPVIR